MKQTITIEVPEGKTYKQTVDKDGNIVIQYIDKEPIRSKSWEEFCINHRKFKKEWYVSSNASIVSNLDGDRGSSCYNQLATKEDAEGILALIQLTRLHDEWVEGSDYKKFDTKAYIYITEKDTLSITVGSLRHFLDFPTSAMAKEFLECFEDLIIKAKKFL